MITETLIWLMWANTILLIGLTILGVMLMATVQQLKDAVAAEAAEVKARVDVLEAEVRSLKDVIAGGGTVTEEQLDEVLESIQGIFTPA